MSSYDEHLISMAGGDGDTVDQLAADLICICTDQCPESDNPCPPCRNMDPYEPCPVVGFGCGSDCGDDEHCTPEQQKAADS